MSRNEDVTTAIWEDLADLTPESKLVYFWSFTNEHNGMSGLYKIRPATIAFETGLTSESVAAALDELAEHEFAFYEDEVMFVRSRVKRIRSKTQQIARSIAKDVHHIAPEHPLRVRFLSLYGDEPWLRDALRSFSVVNLKRGSPEVHESPHKQGDLVNLKRTSVEVPWSGSGSGSGSSCKTRELPEEFPETLKPHLRAVFRVLRDLAQRHNAKAVAPLSLAQTVMARPHKPLVRAAFDFAAWADGQAQRRKDVVSGYRNWLDKTDDLAGLEALDENGRPASTNGGPLREYGRPRRETASDMLRAINEEEQRERELGHH